MDSYGSKPEAPPPIFVVGCPRAGTTLLQSVIANHPAICAFPESNALYYAAADIKLRSFDESVPQRHLLKQRTLGALNRSGLTAGRSRRFRKAMAVFLRQLGADAQLPMLSAPMPTMKALFSCFDRVLSTLAQEQRWLEKSPKNLFVLDYIDRYLPQAQVLHVIRNGPDNIASQRDAGLRRRDFRGDLGGPDGARNAVAQWNRALRVSWRWLGHERHFHIRHEDLCEEPERWGRAICEFLSLDFDPALLQYDPDKLSWSHETWKQHSGPTIRPQPSRFSSALSAEEQEMVLRNALDVDDYLPRRSVRASSEPVTTL